MTWSVKLCANAVAKATCSFRIVLTCEEEKLSCALSRLLSCVCRRGSSKDPEVEAVDMDMVRNAGSFVATGEWMKGCSTGCCPGCTSLTLVPKCSDPCVHSQHFDAHCAPSVAGKAAKETEEAE